MDVTMNNMQISLGRIAERLHTDLIPAAEKDRFLAEELVGVDQLERPDITKAMEEARQVGSIFLVKCSQEVTHFIKSPFHKLQSHRSSSNTFAYRSRLSKIN